MKKIQKVLLCLLLVALAVTCMLAIPVSADTIGGECGDSVTWTIENGTLVISGEGKMADYTKAEQPWKPYRSQITSIRVEEGVTYIGKYCFYYLKQAKSITIPETVTSIAKYAGLSLTGLNEINYASSAAMWQRIVQPLGNDRLLNLEILNSTEPVNAELKLVSLPTKLAYLQHEALDLAGLQVALVDAEGNETLIDKYIVYGYNAASLTTQEITVFADGLFATFNVNVRAEGYCGDQGENIKWTITDTVLELTGTGKTADYTNATAPFRSLYINDVKTVKVGEGITYLGKRIFYYLIKVGTARLPLSLETIADGAFYKTKTIINKYFAGTEYQWSFVNVAKNNETLDAALLRPESSAKLQRIEATQLPNKVLYNGGEALDTTGLVVTGFYDDGSTRDLTDSTKITGYSAENPNVQTLTLNYGGGQGITTIQVEVVAAGTCANGMEWTIEKGILTVTGTGAMDNYDRTGDNQAPWKAYRGNILSVVFGEGITTIGNHALYYAKKLTVVTIPGTVTAVGNGAFRDTAVTEVTFGGSESGWAKVTVGSYNDPLQNAAFTFGEEEDDGTPKLVLSKVKAQAGETVAVTLSIKNNPGVASARLKLSFDTAALTLTQVEDGGILGTAVHKKELTGPYTLCWENDLAVENFTEDGVLVTLYFTVAADAAGEIPLTLTYNTTNGDIMDTDLNDVALNVVNGAITVG